MFIRIVDTYNAMSVPYEIRECIVNFFLKRKSAFEFECQPINVFDVQIKVGRIFTRTVSSFF